MRLILLLIAVLSLPVGAESPRNEDLTKCVHAISTALSNMSPVQISKQDISGSQEEIEKQLPKIVQNIVAAIIYHAQQRIGIEPPDPKKPTDEYDMDQFNVAYLREVGCECESVPGLENAKYLIKRSLIPGKNEKLSFKHIIVWENVFKSLLQEEPARLRSLDASDLECSDL
jgi:hypothetical protein